MSIYKACDIRGRFGSELTVRHARRLGQAVAALHKPAQVLVGGDGRVSTPSLKAALIQALLQGGCQVVDVGILPTPAFYFARLKLGIQTGIQVTASHNPSRDNGFKIILGALPVTEEEVQALASWMEAEDLDVEKPGAVISPGEVIQVDILPAYLASLVPLIPDLSGMKVVVDCANGMAGLIARQVWEQTGAQVHYLLEDVDGTFPGHPPNPAEEKNLSLLKQAVREIRADLGVAYDGDADRVVFVDELGRVVANDKVIVMFAELALKNGPETIVYDQKCSRVVPDTIRARGGNPLMERSGHTFIKTAFLQHSAAYAGELSGHHFFRQIHGDDGLVTSLFFAQHVYKSRQPLSALEQLIPIYPITPDIRLPMAPDQIQQLISDLAENLSAQAEIRMTDGIRLEFEHGWALVRPSVTEPVVSLRFEGQDEESLMRIINTVASASGLLELRELQIPADSSQRRRTGE